MGLGRVLMVWWVVCSVLLGRELPIYIEDSHAGSFGFFAETLDLEGEYTLVLLDAHSDASGVAGSDALRKGLREVLSEGQRLERISEWRREGVIQPFNWIEPLMPRPFVRVIWVAGEKLDDEALAELRREAGVQLDWQSQAVERGAGALKGRFEVLDWERFSKMKLEGKVVVSIDLDFYAQEGIEEERLGVHWDFLSVMPGLEAVSFAVSRPWLRDDGQMWRLVGRAFELALGVRNGRVRFEPFLVDVKDRSEMAKGYYRRGELVPRMKVGEFPRGLRSQLVAAGERVEVRERRGDWEKLLGSWRAELGGWRLSVRDGHWSADGVWRLRVVEDLLIDGPGVDYEKVRWWRYEPASAVYNLRQSLLAGKAFTGEVSSFVGSKKLLMAETDDLALAGETWGEFLPWKGEAGVLRVQAEIVTKEGGFLLPVMEIRVRNREGFLGALAEQFGSPYVFGIGGLRMGVESGGECLVGNDCANFLVYGWRRVGRRVAWGSPGQVRERLVRRGVYAGGRSSVGIDEGWVERGLVVDLGEHFAAVWEDRGELGRLDGEDLVVHHLSGFPEVISMDVLMKGRVGEVGLCELAGGGERRRLVFGGDVNLAGGAGEAILTERQKARVKGEDFFVVNLECGVGGGAVVKLDKGFQFVADAGRLKLLEEAGVDGVSFGNNHAMDGGVAGLKRGLGVLGELGIEFCGVGMNLEGASRPMVYEKGGEKVGFLSVNLIEMDGESAVEEKAGVLSFPLHREVIRKRLLEMNREFDAVVVLPHWGDEYTKVVNDEQRVFARWVIELGADAVVGCHGHRVQPVEYYQGRLIAYGLGNLYFPNVGPEGFGERMLLLLDVDIGGGEFFVGEE